MKTIGKEQFCDLIRAQQISMYRYALGILKNPADAEDAVGEAVLKAYAHLAQLKKPDRFKAWSMSILVNERFIGCIVQMSLSRFVNVNEISAILLGEEKVSVPLF